MNPIELPGPSGLIYADPSLSVALVPSEEGSPIRAEFEGLQSSAGSFPQKPGEAHVDLRIVSLRLRFLQLVALGLVEPDSWEQALATALAHKGADTAERS